MSQENFERYEYFEDSKILELKNGFVGGMLSILNKSAFNISPTVFASCSPGGVITDECYDNIKSKIISRIKNIKDYLVTAYKDPSNKIARAKMLVTSSMGSTAFQKGLGVIHSLSHPINAVNDIHHGLSNAIFMPYVLKFNQNIIEDRIILLSKYIELKDQTFNGFMNWVLELRKDLSIPHTLKDLNVEFDFELLSPMALKDPSTGPNPKDITLNEMKQLYVDSYEGNL